MTLWLILTVLTSVAVVGLAVPLARWKGRLQARDTSVDILRRQLSEIDQQETAGTLDRREAEDLRVGIARRILVEDVSLEQPARGAGPFAIPWMAIALAGVVALSATVLYAVVGRPDLVHTNATPRDDTQLTAQSHPVADVSTMIARLENHLREAPNDAEGWRMLGWSYRSTGRSADAAGAYARAISLDPSNADYLSSRGEALVDAARGEVSADALADFQAAAKIDPADPQTRYFLALWKDQQGQHDQAMAEWISLLKSAPPDAPWVSEVRAFVERVARERGLDLSSKLSQVSSSVPAEPSISDQSVVPALTDGQIANGATMSPGDREQMIRAMVDRLAGDLKANPRNAVGWMQLMRARMVLGDAAAAASAYRNAQQALAGAPTELAMLRKEAQTLRLPGSF
jgi:cytochrome c-type biogenesis protein CcmH